MKFSSRCTMYVVGLYTDICSFLQASQFSMLRMQVNFLSVTFLLETHYTETWSVFNVGIYFPNHCSFFSQKLLYVHRQYIISLILTADIIKHSCVLIFHDIITRSKRSNACTFSLLVWLLVAMICFFPCDYYLTK